MDTQRSSWAVGYEAFAAIMLMVIGVFHVIAGIVAVPSALLMIVARTV